LHRFRKKSIFFIKMINKVNTLSYKTKSAKKETVERKWFVIDAEGEVLGRMCTQVATILRGKHKACYTPHVDCGDNVIIINADKVRMTGAKWDQKEYLSYSGYPGGLKRTSAKEMKAKKPTFIIENAVKGMLPKNRLGRAMIKKLFVYAGAEHKHEAQQPEPLEIKK